MHPLFGTKLKLDTAFREAGELQKAIHTFLNDKQLHKVDTEIDPETGEHVDRVVHTEPPPPEWGIRVGMIAHLMRSALDNLAWQIALLNPKTVVPHNRTG